MADAQKIREAQAFQVASSTRAEGVNGRYLALVLWTSMATRRF